MDHAQGLPPKTPPAPPNARRDLSRMLRVGVCVGLVLSWLIMLLYAWNAFATVPSAERLEESRMAQIPTLLTVRNLLTRSLAELVVLLALLWPAARRYATRVLLALFALTAYFIATVPLTVTTVAWVHRRWLAALTVGLFGIFVAAATARVLAHMRDSEQLHP